MGQASPLLGVKTANKPLVIRVFNAGGVRSEGLAEGLCCLSYTILALLAVVVHSFANNSLSL